jgi:NAD(P)-dependent dehydrogenase (short-subunit alcohol dehydrogenase family)
MQSLDDKTVVVAGGTGNVAAFVVSALLQRGATVAVPSRSDQLRQRLQPERKNLIKEARPKYPIRIIRLK